MEFNAWFFYLFKIMTYVTVFKIQNVVSFNHSEGNVNFKK